MDWPVNFIGCALTGPLMAVLYFQQYGQVRFSGSFSVRFFHSYLFSTTSPLRVSVRSGSFLGPDPLLSITSPVRFLKKYSFLFFAP